MKWFNTPDLQQPQVSYADAHPELEFSIHVVLDIVREEETRPLIGRENIFIGGIGQGFAVAAAALLVDGCGDFAGLIGLNGWLPFSEKLKQGMQHLPASEWVNKAQRLLSPTESSGSLKQALVNGGRPGISSIMPMEYSERKTINRRVLDHSRITPIFMAHPHYDDVVNCSETATASEVFGKMGWGDVNWNDYPDDVGEGQEKHWINTPYGINYLSQWLNDKLSNCPTHPRGGNLPSCIRGRILDGRPPELEGVTEEEIQDAAGDLLAYVPRVAPPRVVPDEQGSEQARADNAPRRGWFDTGLAFFRGPAGQ